MEYHVEIKIKMNARFQHIKHILEFISKEKEDLKDLAYLVMFSNPHQPCFMPKIFLTTHSVSKSQKGLFFLEHCWLPNHFQLPRKSSEEMERVWGPVTLLTGHKSPIGNIVKHFIFYFSLVSYLSSPFIVNYWWPQNIWL